MQHANRRTAGRSMSSSKSANAKPKDAIALLKADHRQVEQWFEEFCKSRSKARRKQTLQAHLRSADRPHDHRGGDLLSGVH